MITFIAFVVFGFVCLLFGGLMGFTKRNDLEAENEALKKEIQRLRDECSEFFI
jgi:hypothetical protein